MYVFTPAPPLSLFDLSSINLSLFSLPCQSPYRSLPSPHSSLPPFIFSPLPLLLSPPSPVPSFSLSLILGTGGSLHRGMRKVATTTKGTIHIHPHPHPTPSHTTLSLILSPTHPSSVLTAYLCLVKCFPPLFLHFSPPTLLLPLSLSHSLSLSHLSPSPPTHTHPRHSTQWQWF